MCIYVWLPRLKYVRVEQLREVYLQHTNQWIF